MKSRNGFWIAILLLLSSTLYAQDKDSVREVILPDSIAAKVIDELQVKDHLVFELHEKDSIITIYQQEVNNLKVEIGMYKLNEVDFRTILTAEQQKNKDKDAQLTSTQKKLTWAKVGEVGLGVLALLELVTILIVASH